MRQRDFTRDPNKQECEVHSGEGAARWVIRREKITHVQGAQ